MHQAVVITVAEIAMLIFWRSAHRFDSSAPGHTSLLRAMAAVAVCTLHVHLQVVTALVQSIKAIDCYWAGLDPP
jgi:hypothetical protein